MLSIKGGAMGVADTIPGVSGGTVAFVTGIYEELVSSLAGLGPSRLVVWRRQGWSAFWQAINGSFLLSVFAGLLLALFAVAQLVDWLLTHQRLALWGFFFALILASAPLVLSRMQRWRAGHLLWLGSGLGIGLGITLLGGGSTPDTVWMVFVAGMIAVGAMVLPGISGSFLLLLIGKYEIMVTAVVERDLLLIVAFGLGAVVGIMSISRLLAALFKRHHDATIVLLTGFMLGSVNALWPWQSGEHGQALHRYHWPWDFAAATGEPAQWLMVSIAALAGVVLVVGFSRLEAGAGRAVYERSDR